MKVKELIEELKKLDQDKEMCISDNETGRIYDVRDNIKFDDIENCYIL